MQWSFLSIPQTTTTSDKPLHLSDKQQVRGVGWWTWLWNDSQTANHLTNSHFVQQYIWMEGGRNNPQTDSYNLRSRPNFVNQAETIFESHSVWTKFQESLNNLSLCNMSVSLKTEMDCPALAKPWKQGLINKGMRGNRSQLATQSYRGQTPCRWQVRAVKIFENLWLCFNALNALK